MDCIVSQTKEDTISVPIAHSFAPARVACTCNYSPIPEL